MNNTGKKRFVALKFLLGRFQDKRGFTIFEILVSLLILSVVMTAMLTFLLGMSRNWQASKDIVDATDNARLGLNRMTRELRQGSKVNVASYDNIQFVVDFGNGEETVSYWYEYGEDGTGQVLRSSSAGEGEAVLMDGVSSLSFSYYGSDYRCDTDSDGVVTFDELLGCSDTPNFKIARVDIDLRVNSGDIIHEFTNQTWLRNRPAT